MVWQCFPFVIENALNVGI